MDKTMYGPITNDKEMTSSWRVMSFFFVVFVLPTLLISIPLYARYQLYPTRHFWATDGDVMSLHSSVSSFWCQGQKVIVNGSFEAFQIPNAVVESHKSIKRKMPLEASLFLQHDDAEEWGFYLVKGSTFSFSACARWPGGTLVVVKSKENLRKCFYHEDSLREELEERKLESALAQTVKTDPFQDRHANDLMSKDENQGGELLDDTDPSLLNAEIADRIFFSTAKISGDISKLSEVKSVNSDLILNKWKHKNSLANTSFHHLSSKGLSLGIFTINDTIEVYAGNSSISSSEEFLSHCTSTIASIDLTPYIDCKERINISSSSDIKWKFKVNESDFYYFIFSSDNSVEANVIDFSLLLQKSMYNVTDAKSRCIDSKECFFSFPFLSTTGVILDVKGNYNNIKNLKDLNNYEVVSVCQPRFLVYTVLIILVPFIIVLFAFR